MPSPRRRIIGAFAGILLLAGGTASASAQRAAPAQQPARAAEAGRDTLKQRLSDKGSDEQRVNDCKVPPERRGTSHRPTDCAEAHSRP
jgi:hypothetical protein